MLSTPKTDNRGVGVNENCIKIDFGVVSVGSVHKRSIDITNDLKASFWFLTYLPTYFCPSDIRLVCCYHLKFQLKIFH